MDIPRITFLKHTTSPTPCRQFEELSERGEKVGEASKVLQEQLAALQAEEEDTSCGVIEEGQSNSETTDPKKEGKV